MDLKTTPRARQRRIPLEMMFADTQILSQPTKKPRTGAEEDVKERVRRETLEEINSLIEKSVSALDVKAPRGQKMCDKSRILLTRVHETFASFSQSIGHLVPAVKDSRRLTAVATGLAEKTVRFAVAKNRPSLPRVLSPLPSCQMVSTEEKEPGEEESQLSPLNPALLEQIRLYIHGYYSIGRKVDLRSLHSNLRANLGEFGYNYKSHVSLWKIIMQLGFKFLTVDNRCMIFHKADLTRKRHAYLTAIKQYRADNSYIVFCDESWFFQGMKCKRDWVDETAYNNPQVYLDMGVKINPDPAPSRGRRAIMIGTFTETGMLSGSFRVHLDRGRAESGDYHESMTAELFESYGEEVFPMVKAAAEDRKAIFILDNASYHNQYDKKLPTTASRKQEIAEYLKGQKIAVSDNLKKKDLLELLQNFYKNNGGKENLRFYRLDLIAEKHGVKLLRLPPYHCMLNPIEHVWRYVKGRLCAKTSGEEKLEELKEKATGFIETMPNEMSKNIYQNAIHVEDDFIAKENLSIVTQVEGGQETGFGDFDEEYLSEEEYY